MHRSSAWIWAGRIAAVLLLAGLAAYLASVGLGKADKLASVLGLVVAVAALLAPYLLPTSDSSPNSGPVQSVVNTVVGGNLTQTQEAKSGQAPEAKPSSVPPAEPPALAPEQGPPSGQYVNGVWVGGSLTQVNDAVGDVTPE